MLVVFGGLPGTGKTTVSRMLAARRSAPFLRIDTIETAPRSTGVPAGGVGTAGYIIGNALAASNLSNGLTVIVDCVNPVDDSRRGWRATAALAGIQLLEVEIVCSDPVEHRRRIEGRKAEAAEDRLPDWKAVLDYRYAPWPEPHFVIDTAGITAAQAVERIERLMDARVS